MHRSQATTCQYCGQGTLESKYSAKIAGKEMVACRQAHLDNLLMIESNPDGLIEKVENAIQVQLDRLNGMIMIQDNDQLQVALLIGNGREDDQIMSQLRESIRHLQRLKWYLEHARQWPEYTHESDVDRIVVIQPAGDESEGQ